MARGASVSISTRGFDKVGRRLAGAAVDAKASIGRATERATRAVERDLKSRSFTGRKGSDPFWGVTAPPASTGTVGARSGHTRRSITGRVFRAGGAFLGVVGTALRHVRLLEEGGTISGRFRIPTRWSQTAASVDRNAGRSVRGLGYWVWPNRAQRAGALSHIKGRYLAGSVGGALRLYYLLKTTLRYRARHMFKRCIERMRPAIAREYAGEVRSLTLRINR